MRFISRLWVMDVMDTLVVSGYVQDADPHEASREAEWHFTESIPGVGEPDPALWLLRALADVQDPLSASRALQGVLSPLGGASKPTAPHRHRN
jgi:hypothetical protein